MAIKSQGTHLYFLDDVSDPDNPLLIKLSCPTGITGVGGGTKNQINVTCLDETEEEQFESGLSTPSALSIPYNFDPALVNHQVLNHLKKDGGNVDWLLCLSDGDSVPAVTAGRITPPTDRTSVSFRAYISENSLDISSNDVVKGTLSLQRSGAETWTYK